MRRPSTGLWQAALGALSLALLLPSCWEGEPYEDIDNPLSPVENDLTYTAVTSNVKNVTAVSIELYGYANSDDNPLRKDINEQGFLISRFVAEPSYEAALTTQPGQEDYVRRVECATADDNNAIHAFANHLAPANDYYFRTYVVKKEKVYYGVVKRFRTPQLTVTMYEPPPHIGLREVDLQCKFSGLRAADYSDELCLRFRCYDADQEYDSTKVAAPGDVDERKTAHFDHITPGVVYAAYAYFTVESDFWRYEVDNPDLGGGTFNFGTQPRDICTEKFKTGTITFASTTLTGVVPYVSTNIAVDYDVATLYDNYFTMPVDTFVADEYGVALLDEEGELTYYPSPGPLKEGNRYDVTIDNLTLNHTFRFVSYVKIFGLTFLSDTHEGGIGSFKTADYTPEAIDMDLSVYWARQNVGAPDEYSPGMFYSWGELEPKREYSEDSYKGPGLDVWHISGTEWDVAHVKWGGKWRMPTADEVYELLWNCEWEWDEEHNGLRVTSWNQNTIFLPAAGLKTDDQFKFGPGTKTPVGRYWSGDRARDETDFGLVYEIAFFYATIGVPENPGRWVAKPTEGFTIRPVCDK